MLNGEQELGGDPTQTPKPPQKEEDENETKRIEGDKKKANGTHLQ